MDKKKNPVRNREKRINLKGLYAVPSEIAYQNGKPRPEVYGYVNKDTPFICKAQVNGSQKAPQFLSDMTGNNVPDVLKNRMLAFWHDKHNSSKSVCYLVEKSLYLEMVQRNKSRFK